MEVIFHEKQDGRLCAQHCLNAVLQGPYYSAVELSELANRLDEEERIRMAENGIDTEEYRRFLEQPSNNMDDTGYFSVQVISRALALWGLDLVNYWSSEPRALEARSDPSKMNAFICHHQNHWFCIRRFGTEWFNLNSLLNGPKYMSNTYLAEFLMELQSSGYTVFVVYGDLPQCDADKLMAQDNSVSFRSVAHPESPPPTPIEETAQIISQTISHQPRVRIIPIEVEQPIGETPPAPAADTLIEDEDLQRAISLSLQCATVPAPSGAPQSSTPTNVDDEDFEAALRLSLECFTTPVTPEVLDPTEMRRLRLARFESATSTQEETNS